MFMGLEIIFRVHQITSSRKAVAASMICTAIRTSLVNGRFRYVSRALGDLASRTAADRCRRLLSTWSRELHPLVTLAPREARFSHAPLATEVNETIEPHTRRLPLLFQDKSRRAPSRVVRVIGHRGSGAFDGK